MKKLYMYGLGEGFIKLEKKKLPDVDLWSHLYLWGQTVGSQHFPCLWGRNFGSWY